MERKRRQIEEYDTLATPSAELARAYRDAIESEEGDRNLGIVHYRGGQVEFNLGREYARSADPLDREVGAQILAQLGWQDRTFLNESVNVLLPLVADADEGGGDRHRLCARSPEIAARDPRAAPAGGARERGCAARGGERAFVPR